MQETIIMLHKTPNEIINLCCRKGLSGYFDCLQSLQYNFTCQNLAKNIRQLLDLSGAVSEAILTCYVVVFWRTKHVSW